MSRLCYRHDVCPSVGLSVRLYVTFVGDDHTVQQKMEVGTPAPRWKALSNVAIRRSVSLAHARSLKKSW